MTEKKFYELSITIKGDSPETVLRHLQAIYETIIPPQDNCSGVSASEVSLKGNHYLRWEVK